MTHTNQDFDLLWEAYSNPSSDGDTTDSKGTVKISKPKKNEHGEWVAKVYIDGKYKERPTYYTDDKQDAEISRKNALERYEKDGYTIVESYSDDEDELEDEDEDETVEEGILDRTKARISGVKDAMGASKTHLKHAFGGGKGEKGKDVGREYEKSKVNSILQSHVKKLDSQLSSLVTDATNLGVMDQDEAESFANSISSEIHKIMQSQNYGRTLNKTGRKF